MEGCLAEPTRGPSSTRARERTLVMKCVVAEEDTGQTSELIQEERRRGSKPRRSKVKGNALP